MSPHDCHSHCYRGLSRLLHMAAEAAAAVTYLLKATFTAANQSFTDGQVLDTAAEGVEVGQLTAKDTSTGTLDIVSNQLVVGAESNWISTGVFGEALTRAIGTAILFKFQKSASVDRILVGLSDVYDIQDNPEVGVKLVDGLYKCTDNHSLKSVNTAYPAISEVDVAIVLGGYDVNGVPYKSGDTKANFTYGAAYFIKDVNHTNWVLVHNGKNSDAATLYPMLASRDTFEVDSIRVPDIDLSALLEPVLLDTFTLSYGAEEVTNGGFDTDTDWTKGDGWTISGGTASCDGTQVANSLLEQTTLVPVAAKTYQVTFTMSGRTAGILYLNLGGVGAPSGFNTNETHTVHITTTNTNHLKFTATVDFVGSIDDVSIKEVLDPTQIDIENHDPDYDSVGTGWSIVGVGFSLEAGHVVGDTSGAFAVIDSGDSDLISEITINMNGQTARQVRQIIRYQDIDNYWYGWMHATAALRIYEYVAGVNTQRASGGVAFDASTDFRSVLTADDEEITLVFNDADRITYGLATTLKTETHVGIWTERLQQQVKDIAIYPRGTGLEYSDLDNY